MEVESLRLGDAAAILAVQLGLVATFMNLISHCKPCDIKLEALYVGASVEQCASRCRRIPLASSGIQLVPGWLFAPLLILWAPDLDRGRILTVSIARLRLRSFASALYY